ncbi:MAG TPA: hypothetical protein VME66_07985 [Candidatus Acidoferrales bacterium]|nr:hypothetical protein [Candidatus Acidoferrales bacterium]
MSSAGRPLLDFFQARDWAAVTTVESFDPKDDDIIVFVLREGNGPYAVVPILDPYGLGMPRLLEGYPPVYLTSHESVSVSRLPIANWHPISLGD